MYFAYLKFINGEEILTQVVQEDEKSIVLRDPVGIYKQHTQHGSMVHCAFWLSFSKSGKVSIDKNKILVLSQDLLQDTVDQYKQFVMESWMDKFDKDVSDAGIVDFNENTTVH